MKKIIALLLAVLSVFCLALTGCKIDNSDDESTKVIEENDIPEGVTISPKGNEIYKGTKEGKTRLKISYANTGYGSLWLQVLSAHFIDENPEYWILLDGDPGLTDSVSTKLDTGINLSDVYFLLASNSLNYSRSGWLEDLAEVYNSKPDGEDRKTVYEKMPEKWQYHSWEPYLGEYKQYVYPWTESITGIAYNKGMFDKYGWEIPKTVKELVALCDKIKVDTKGEIAPFVYPGQVGGYFYIVYTWWLQSAGYDSIEEYFRFEDVEVFNPEKQPEKGKLEALEAFVSLFGPDVDYSLEGSLSKNHTEAQLSFLRGEAAMIPNASWMETEMKDDMPEGFQVRLMEAPYLDTARKNADGAYERYSMACSPDYAIIPSGATQKAAAKKFLSFISRDDMLLLFTKYAGTLRPFEYDITPVWSELTEFTKSCIEVRKGATYWLETSRADMYTFGFTQCFLNTANPFPSLINGPKAKGVTPEEFCLREYSYALENWKTWEETIARSKTK